METNNHEKLLVIEIIDGNEKAFQQLFESYYKDIYTYSWSILKSHEYAQEMVQEVFLSVWLHREKLNPELSFKSFIFTITRNLSFNFLKKLANDKKLRETLFYKSQKNCNTTDTHVQDADYDKIKYAAIENLPPKRKHIFELSRNQDMSYEDISFQLGISVSTVKTQMSKALKFIRQFLKVNGDITFFLFYFFY
jgi:RNA polymerase sigma-70 factor (family 1)